MGWKSKVSVLAVAYLALAAAIVHYEREEFPIRGGSAQEYWFVVARVKLEGPSQLTRGFGGTYRTDDDWRVYYLQGFHGQFLYRVSKEEVYAALPQVIEHLEKTKPDAAMAPIIDAFAEWKRGDRTDANRSVELIQESRIKHREKDDIDRKGFDLKSYYQQRQAAFAERYERIARYWLNIAFESAYLSFLMLFAAWPWLRSKGVIAWGCHLGLAPFLFFLPYYLGYAPYTFTSAGPIGGVLYPHLLHAVGRSREPWPALDVWVVRNVPHPLIDLNQTTGPMLSLSGGGGVGPLTALGIGIAFGVALIALRKGIPWAYQEYRKQVRKPEA